MKSLERFHAIATAPLSQWHELFPHHRPVGIYNAYVPEELFHAAGLTPVYIFHASRDRGHAQSHLPSFACWPSRSLVDQIGAGELQGVAGIAFAQTCDTVQALTDICRTLWRASTSSPSVYHIGVPTHLDRGVAQGYLVSELRRLRRILGEPSDRALAQACAVYNRTRALIERLYSHAANLPPTDLYAVLRAGLVMPKDEYNPLLADLLDELPSGPTPGRSRLVLVGPHLADPTIYDLIEAADGRVVDDLLDVGHRYYVPPLPHSGDPVRRLADRILATLPTPSKYHPSRRRDEFLIQVVAQRRAHGVIFARQKFCDPHGFDYARLGAALEERGIAHMLLELEQAPQIGQMRTRIQAFLETVRN